MAFVRHDRFDSGEAARSFFRGAPDLAVGILVRVIDPERRRVAVYRSLLDRQRLEEGDTLEGGEVLPGLTIALADLFRP